METRKTQLEATGYYHIYNRGINGQNIFIEEQNYVYFLQKYAQYVHPFVETFAYCLLKNHFHLLVRVKSEQEIRTFLGSKHKDKSCSWIASNAFSSFFKSYAQSINKKYTRTGGLFEEPFHRIEVDNDAYFSALIAYIHHNPQKHGFVADFKAYPHSSYESHLQNKTTKLNRKQVIDWFGNFDEYQKFHANYTKAPELNKFCLEFD